MMSLALMLSSADLSSAGKAAVLAAAFVFAGGLLVGMLVHAITSVSRASKRPLKRTCFFIVDLPRIKLELDRNVSMLKLAPSQMQARHEPPPRENEARLRAFGLCPRM